MKRASILSYGHLYIGMQCTLYIFPLRKGWSSIHILVIISNVTAINGMYIVWMMKKYFLNVHKKPMSFSGNVSTGSYLNFKYNWCPSVVHGLFDNYKYL